MGLGGSALGNDGRRRECVGQAERVPPFRRQLLGERAVAAHLSGELHVQSVAVEPRVRQLGGSKGAVQIRIGLTIVLVHTPLPRRSPRVDAPFQRVVGVCGEADRAPRHQRTARHHGAALGVDRDVVDVDAERARRPASRGPLEQSARVELEPEARRQPHVHHRETARGVRRRRSGDGLGRGGGIRRVPTPRHTRATHSDRGDEERIAQKVLPRARELAEPGVHRFRVGAPLRREVIVHRPCEPHASVERGARLGV